MTEKEKGYVETVRIEAQGDGARRPYHAFNKQKLEEAIRSELEE